MLSGKAATLYGVAISAMVCSTGKKNPLGRYLFVSGVSLNLGSTEASAGFKKIIFAEKMAPSSQPTAAAPRKVNRVSSRRELFLLMSAGKKFLEPLSVACLRIQLEVESYPGDGWNRNLIVGSGRILPLSHCVFRCV